MGSIVLNPGVKEMLLEDTKDFLRSEKVCLNDPTSSPNTLGTCHAVTGSTSHGHAVLPAPLSRRLCISPDRLFLTFIWLTHSFFFDSGTQTVVSPSDVVISSMVFQDPANHH